jgi:hypothetical protein
MAFHHDPDVVPVYIALLIFAALVVLIVVVIKVVIFCKIFSKAGYSWTSFPRQAIVGPSVC